MKDQLQVFGVLKNEYWKKKKEETMKHLLLYTK